MAFPIPAQGVRTSQTAFDAMGEGARGSVRESCVTPATKAPKRETDIALLPFVLRSTRSWARNAAPLYDVGSAVSSVTPASIKAQRIFFNSSAVGTAPKLDRPRKSMTSVSRARPRT